MVTRLRVENRFDGHSNFGAWKERIINVLEEAEVWGIVEKTIVLPTNADELAAYKKSSIKAKRLILNGVEDHVIPHVRGKDNAFEVWAALTSLYQNSNENRKMALRDKLKTIRMKGSESVVAYLSRFTDVRDELVAIGDAVADTELVRTALQGFPKSWEVFVEGIVAREHLPSWDRLWSDCV